MGKTDLLLLNLFEIPTCHKTCRLQTETKERFVWLIWSSVLLRCHQKMTISRRWLRRNVNLGRNEKLGSLEISIVRKFAFPMSFGSWLFWLEPEMANWHLDLTQLFLFQISQRLQTGSRKRTKNKFISSQSCEQGMYMQWTKGTNYIVKTPVTLLCTGYSKEKPLWNPGISHFSGDLK